MLSLSPQTTCWCFGPFNILGEYMDINKVCKRCGDLKPHRQKYGGAAGQTSRYCRKCEARGDKVDKIPPQDKEYQYAIKWWSTTTEVDTSNIVTNNDQTTTVTEPSQQNAQSISAAPAAPVVTGETLFHKCKKWLRRMFS